MSDNYVLLSSILCKKGIILINLLESLGESFFNLKNETENHRFLPIRMWLCLDVWPGNAAAILLLAWIWCCYQRHNRMLESTWALDDKTNCSVPGADPTTDYHLWILFELRSSVTCRSKHSTLYSRLSVDGIFSKF